MADFNDEEELQRIIEEIERTGRTSSESIERFSAGLDGSTKGLTKREKAAQAQAKTAATVSANLKAAGEQAKQFGKGLQDGNADLSQVIGSMSSVLKSIPLVGGVLGATFSGLGKQVQYSIETMEELGKAGALGATGIIGFKEQWADSLIPMQTYRDYLVSNASALAAMSGSVASGSAQFSKLTKEMVGGQVGERLRGLGISTEELIESTGDYLRLQTALGRTQNKDARQLSVMTGAYFEELDQLTRLTGVSRKEQMALRESAMAEAAWNAHQNMATDSIRKEFDKMNVIFAEGSPQIAKGFRDFSNNITNTPEAKLFVQQLGGNAQAVNAALEAGMSANTVLNKYVIPGAKQMSGVLLQLGVYGNELSDNNLGWQKIINRTMISDKELADQQQHSAASSKKEAQIKKDLMDANLAYQKVMVKAEPAMTDFLKTITGWVSKTSTLSVDVIGSMDSFFETAKLNDRSVVEQAWENIKHSFSETISNSIEDAIAKSFGGHLGFDSYAEVMGQRAIAQGKSADEVTRQIKIQELKDSIKSDKESIYNIGQSIKKLPKNLSLERQWKRNTIEKINERMATAIEEMLKLQKEDKHKERGAIGGTSSSGMSAEAAVTMAHEGKPKVNGLYMPYKDNDQYTIGYGHKVKKGEDFSKGLTEKQAISLFKSDFKSHVAAAKLMPGYGGLKKGAQEAIDDMTFNMGAGWWKTTNNHKGWPRFVEAVKNKDYKKMAEEIAGSKYAKDVGSRATANQALIQASKGGLMQGSLGGFPAMLHGDEMVTPVNNGVFPAHFNEAYQTMLTEFENKKGNDNLAPVASSIDKMNGNLSGAVQHLSTQVGLMQTMVNEMSKTSASTAESARAQSKIAAATI